MLKGYVKNNDGVDDPVKVYYEILSCKNNVLYLLIKNGTCFAESIDHWQQFLNCS